MIPARIAIPPPPNRTKSRADLRRASPEKTESRGSTQTQATSLSAADRRNRSMDSEERNLMAVIALMFLMLVLPAALMLIYIFTNPDAFQFNEPFPR